MSGTIKRSCVFTAPPAMYVYGFLSVCLVAYLDYTTGSELGFFVFYIVPIIVFTIEAGLCAGIALSILSAVLWFAIDYVTRDSAHLFHVAWNSATRLTVFLFCSYSVWKAHYYRQLQKELTNYVVHDLRTPVANSLCSLDILEGKIKDPLNPDQLHFTGMIRISMKRLITLIDSILSLAHLERGDARIEAAPFDVRDLLLEAIEEVSVWAERNGVKIEMQMVPESITCQADQKIVLRIFINLLSNAIKLSQRNSSISIKSSGDKDKVVFSVSDSGPGLRPEDLKAILSKFGPSSPYIGSGFGLRFCRAAVKANGGRIWAESKVGKGTTVHFTLPKG